jgi:general secretion pathway protein B
MSFILDALKKSELERQRQTMPGLMDSGTVTRRPTLPRWAIALGLLLAVNLVVLVVVLLRNATPAVPAMAVSGARAAATPPALVAGAAAPAPSSPVPAAAGPDHFSPLDTAASGPTAAANAMDAPPVYAPEIPVEPSAEAAPTGASLARSSKPPHRDPQLTDESGSDDDEVLPSFSELNLTGPQGLPELHIDVHVYATRPSERFVYINMRKYREGATLQEGPVLERIRRDGAILNYHGLRFILPRQ